MHIAVRASNRIEVLLEMNGATAIIRNSAAVATRRSAGEPRGRAATMASAVPAIRMSRFTRRSASSPIAFAAEQAGWTPHQDQDQDREDQHIPLRQHVRAAELIH